MNNKYTKWVACWGNAISITDRKECVYAKNISLRYPIEMCFSGNRIRVHFSNLTGTEDVNISEACVDGIAITCEGNSKITIPAGGEIVSDEVDISIEKGRVINVSMYLAECTQMNSGTLITGPMSIGKYAYGNYIYDDDFPIDMARNTNWFYFISTIDILTEEKNHALICYGDSITAQSWPDYLKIRAKRDGYDNVSIIRRAVSGTRILRQYDCITYQAYGLKGATRFPIESKVDGADSIIIQHGINDIIHPVGEDVNVFRPWSDMPSVEDLINGTTEIYVNHARSLGLKVWSGTLLPIYGWRTYEPFRDKLRTEFNDWLRTSDIFDGCVDFDKAVRDENSPVKFAEGCDSGDHLHPSELAYERMAECVPVCLLK